MTSGERGDGERLRADEENTSVDAQASKCKQ